MDLVARATAAPTVTAFWAQEIPLTEGTVLREGVLADRVKAAVERAQERFHDMPYALLAKAVVQAQARTQDPAVQATLGKVAKVAGFAMRNRALLMVLFGLVSALVGLGTSAAQAAPKVDAILSGDLDTIIDNLHRAGIDLTPDLDLGLPAGLDASVAKAAKAIRAIDAFEARDGIAIASSRDVLVQATVDKTGMTFVEHIVVTTPDRSLTLMEVHTTIVSENGQPVHRSETQAGVKFALYDLLKGLDLKQTAQVQSYLGNALPDLTEDAGGIFARIKAMLARKVEAIGSTVATKLARYPDGRYTVVIGPQGLKLTR